MDKYANFKSLRKAESEGTDYRIRLQVLPKCRTIVIAPHGGGIEPGTSEIALAIAGDDLQFYAFEGIKPKDNKKDLHITSTNFDEPKCLNLVKSAEHVLAVHGERTNCKFIYVGGADKVLASYVTKALAAAGFPVRAHADPNLQGTSADNVCNRGTRKMGVQLEITSGFRKTLFKSLTVKGREQTTKRFCLFVATVRKGLASGGAL